MEFIITSTEVGNRPNEILRKYPCLKSDFKAVNYPDINTNWTFLKIEIKDLTEFQLLADKLEKEIIFTPTKWRFADMPTLEIYDNWRE